MGLTRRRNLSSVTDLRKENKGTGRRHSTEGERSQMEEEDGAERAGGEGQSLWETDPRRRGSFSSVILVHLPWAL